MCTPDDLCDGDYTHTIADMLESMWLLGCEGQTLGLLEERFDQALMDCGTILTITSQLSIESGGIEIYTVGTVPISMTSNGNNTATIDGNGKLEVSGYGDGGGECTGVVSGETSAKVSGTRDASYTYELYVDLAQNSLSKK